MVTREVLPSIRKTFKFQYGATNIFSNVNTAGRINAFKFQYGATNM